MEEKQRRRKTDKMADKTMEAISKFGPTLATIICGMVSGIIAFYAFKGSVEVSIANLQGSINLVSKTQEQNSKDIEHNRKKNYDLYTQFKEDQKSRDRIKEQNTKEMNELSKNILVLTGSLNGFVKILDATYSTKDDLRKLEKGIAEELKAIEKEKLSKYEVDTRLIKTAFRDNK